jgi:hypothetical protein
VPASVCLPGRREPTPEEAAFADARTAEPASQMSAMLPILDSGSVFRRRLSGPRRFGSEDPTLSACPSSPSLPNSARHAVENRDHHRLARHPLRDKC